MRNPIFLLSLGGTLLALGAPRVSAQDLWYNGDFNGQRTLANGNGITPNGNSSGNYNVYDNFNVTSPGWVVTGVFSNDDTNITTALAHGRGLLRACPPATGAPSSPAEMPQPPRHPRAAPLSVTRSTRSR